MVQSSKSTWHNLFTGCNVVVEAGNLRTGLLFISLAVAGCMQAVRVIPIGYTSRCNLKDPRK